MLPTTICDLARIAGISDVRQIHHFITGRADGGDINIDVPAGRCIAIVQIIQNEDADRTAVRTITISSAGRVQDLTPNIDIAASGEVMYVFPPGRVVITLAVTALAGKTVQTQIGWFELPFEAMEVLQQCATQQLSQ